MFFIDVKNQEEVEIKIGELGGELQHIENSYVTLDYLRSPISNQNFVISDLVRESYLLDSFENLQAETKLILDEVYGSCYSVYVEGASESAVITSNVEVLSNLEVSCVDLPIKIDETIEVCVDFSKYQELLGEEKEVECFE